MNRFIFCIAAALALFNTFPSPVLGEKESQWDYLNKYVDNVSEDASNLLKTEPLKSRLENLARTNYQDLLTNMGTMSPLLRENGILYLTGNKPHSGTDNAAAVVIDPSQDLVFVWLKLNDESLEFKERETLPELPSDVKAVMSN
ncbi:MAG: hypothetical protein KDD70_04575 [Bdellovibrionales bacterium]|nr:hypothetical protein [Bdellovibrionales bacterium]